MSHLVTWFIALLVLISFPKIVWFDMRLEGVLVTALLWEGPLVLPPLVAVYLGPVER